VKVVLNDFPGLAAVMIKAACESLMAAESTLTKYDWITWDSDCGLTMERGAKELLSRLESKSLDTSHPVPLFLNMADAVSASMGGTSGVLIELMLRTMSTFLNSSDAVDVDAKRLAEVFHGRSESHVLLWWC
jgi:dihydroxyacetone kinase